MAKSPIDVRAELKNEILPLFFSMAHKALMQEDWRLWEQIRKNVWLRTLMSPGTWGQFETGLVRSVLQEYLGHPDNDWGLLWECNYTDAPQRHADLGIRVEKPDGEDNTPDVLIEFKNIWATNTQIVVEDAIKLRDHAEGKGKFLLVMIRQDSWEPDTKLPLGPSPFGEKTVFSNLINDLNKVKFPIDDELTFTAPFAFTSSYLHNFKECTAQVALWMIGAI